MTDFEYDPSDSPIQFDRLVDHAISQILDCQDSQVFINWMRTNIYNYYSGPVAQQPGMFDEHDETGSLQFNMDRDLARALAANLAHMIWNSVPLPSKNFKPMPLKMPGRNDPCLCGSGKKYKQCCAGLPKMATISSTEIWPIMFDKLDKSTMTRAIRENHIPLDALIVIALEYLESGRAKKSIALLKHLFEGKIRKTNHDAEYALNLLCDGYDNLGYENKKTELLQSIINRTPRSPLRSGAWQRLAAMKIDSGDAEGAWNAFKNAQRDDPDSISLSVLEVQILNAQGSNEKAAERADFWVRRLRRTGMKDTEMPLSFLIEVVKNPMEAFADFGLSVVDDAGLLLKQWLEQVQERPLPNYTIDDEVTDFDLEDRGDFREFSEALSASGLDQQQIDQAIQEFENLPESEEDVELATQSMGDSIQTPANLKELEQEWRAVFEIEKPFSVHETPFGQYDPWDVDDEIKWSSWLQDNPQAFDSLDILDDLATALMMHPQIGSPWLDETLLKPILLRAEAIVNKVVAANDGLQLPWIMPANRSGLRALSRLIAMAMGKDAQGEVFTRAQSLIRINPDDNHGYRMIIMNQLIDNGRNDEALQLADRYPEDLNPEIVYGKILALYRLGRHKDAVKVLADAQEFLGKIPRYLIAKRVKKPKLDPGAVQFGGDDQAWYYREEMRDVWLRTPGALEWLKKAQSVMML